MQPETATRIIVVDDETDLCETVAEYLSRHHYDVRTASCGASLDACLGRGPADLVLLDINMSGEDGLSIAQRLRASSEIPIIMLTAVHGIDDRVGALQVGADDYITKPFDLRELLARVRTVLRRAAGGATGRGDAGPIARPERPAAKLVSFGRVRLDLEKHCLVDQDGACQDLTAMEFDLLATFARHPNRVLSRDRLLALAHNRDIEPYDRSIDIRITRIRKKIEADSAQPQIIRTVRGEGYVFVPPKDARGAG
jgi:two-component system OmpR family response regulator